MTVGGKKRAVCVWHRRAGKDSTALNFTATSMFERPGTYFHMLPTQKQARKVVWDGRNDKGRFLNQAFPNEIVSARRSQDMQTELVNGSLHQLCGSDNYDSLVGSNPFGVIFSEWSLCDPKAWDYMRPILAENGGWAIFIYTARGKNHGYRLYEMAKNNKDWHNSLLTVNDTINNDGDPIISPEAIEEERLAGMSEDMIQQEFYCSFDVAIPGAYFADEIGAARADKRIGFIPVEPHLLVHTFWDLGISKGNAMVVWFVQALGKEIRVINCIEQEGKPMSWFIQRVNDFARDHRISYGEHFAPHDIGVRSMMTGVTREKTAREMGINFTKVPKTVDLNDSIEATRRLISRCWFDDTRGDMERAVSALASYHRKWDSLHETYADKPEHDWTSNFADAFRQMAQAWNDRLSLNVKRPTIPIVAKHDFGIF